MLGQLMKLSVSKSPAGQKVPDMVSVKRVSQLALQYSNFPREILNEYRLRLSVWHEILSNIINDMYVSIWTTLWENCSPYSNLDITSVPKDATMCAAVQYRAPSWPSFGVFSFWPWLFNIWRLTYIKSWTSIVLSLTLFTRWDYQLWVQSYSE